MWFVFPSGAEAITVEQQQFGVEYTDKQGVNYFRAPDHFSPKILAITGFTAVSQPEDGPADLPKSDPQRDGAIVGLTQQAVADKIEIQNLNTDLRTATARIVALNTEKTELVAKLAKAEAKIEALQEQLEDKPAAVPLKKAG